MTKLSIDCETILFNRDKVNKLVMDLQKEIDKMKAEQTRCAHAVAKECEAYFRSFPFSDAGRALVPQYRQQLVAGRRYLSLPLFLAELSKAVQEVITQSGPPLKLDAASLIRSIP